MQNNKSLNRISTKLVEYKNSSNWKFVQLEFATENTPNKIVVEITKETKGNAYIDDVGIIPKL